MFFIMGMSNKEEYLGDIHFECTNCVKETFGMLERSNVFTFFFIPIFKFGKQTLIVCKNCSSVYKLKQDEVARIRENGRVTYDDIEEVVINRRVCRNCGHAIGNASNFCSNCGEKI